MKQTGGSERIVRIGRSKRENNIGAALCILPTVHCLLLGYLLRSARCVAHKLLAHCPLRSECPHTVHCPLPIAHTWPIHCPLLSVPTAYCASCAYCAHCPLPTAAPLPHCPDKSFAIASALRKRVTQEELHTRARSALVMKEGAGESFWL